MTTSTKVKRSWLAEEPEWIVWLLVLVMLVIGLALKGGVEGRMASYSGLGVSLQYPAGWLNTTPDEEQAFQFNAAASATGRFPMQIQVLQTPLDDVGRNLNSLDDLALAWSTQHSRELESYSALSVDTLDVGGQKAAVVEYAYVSAEAVRGAASTGVPVVARAQDVLIQKDDMLTVVTFAADSNEYDQAVSIWAKILASLKLQ